MFSAQTIAKVAIGTSNQNFRSREIIAEYSASIFAQQHTSASPPPSWAIKSELASGALLPLLLQPPCKGPGVGLARFAAPTKSSGKATTDSLDKGKAEAKDNEEAKRFTEVLDAVLGTKTMSAVGSDQFSLSKIADRLPKVATTISKSADALGVELGKTRDLLEDTNALKNISTVLAGPLTVTTRLAGFFRLPKATRN